MTTEAISIHPAATPARLTAVDMIARTHLVREVMEAVMKKDVHYGVIPGTDKPSLWQPGAEKLLMAFQLEPVLEVDDLSIHGEVARFRVTCRVRHVPTGEFVGAGLGECSSDEEKFRWRSVVCKEEFDATPVDRRRTKWKKGRDKAWSTDQIRTEPADLANTVLKMAKKRALVDAAKSTTAASDVFDQDLEDLQEGLDRDEERRGVAQPERKSTTTESAGSSTEEKAGSDRGEGSSAVAAAIPDELWDAVKKQWHSKGAISVPQQNRLFAIARRSGWDPTQLRQALEKGLGIAHSNEIPTGKAYDQVVAIFQKYRPEGAGA